MRVKWGWGNQLRIPRRRPIVQSCYSELEYSMLKWTYVIENGQKLE
jgi:hypothetical protein